MHQRYRSLVLCLLAVATTAPALSSATPWHSDAVAQPAAVAPDQAAVLQVVNILYFRNSARLTADGKDTLDEMALSMKQFSDSRLQITGYLMPGEPNLDQLSLRRAESVRNYLVTRHGIDPARMPFSGGIAGQEQTDALDAQTQGRLKQMGLAVLTLTLNEQ